MATSISRVKASLTGGMEDRPPVGVWAHNFTRENSPEDLAEETVRVVKHYGWDFAKIQNRATSFGEDWGLRFKPSDKYYVLPEVIELPVRDSTGLRNLRPVDPTEGVLGEQLRALRMIRKALGDEFPVIQTVFSPSMVLPFLMEKDMKKHGPCLRSVIQDYPQAARQALTALKETYVNFVKAALEGGADGVFYTIKPAGKAFLSLDQYKEFCLEDDAEVLQAANGGWFNMLHLCGSGVYFDVIPELPCHAVNYEVLPEHPKLSEVRDKYGKTVMGGLSPKPYTVSLTPAQVAAEVTSALEDTKGLGFMVAPGCSISPDTPEENLFAMHAAIRGWLSKDKQ